jgi:bifunctional UDP-N-acetylglucosamine pyrophosphorylase/glucosamine-1-phosphate N-acetyltransferase
MILSVIILAAGQGTRMNSDMPKVFHEVGNYPMICHVLDISQKLKAKSTTVVISNKLKNYKTFLLSKYQHIKFCYQHNQLGTAHAVLEAFKNYEIKETDTTLVLYGDTPSVTFKTLNAALRDFDKKNLDLSVISMIVKDLNNSYGRLLIKKGKLNKIIEKTEQTNEEKKIQLCNSGIMIIKTKHLFKKIKKIKNKNKKKEFYLTDLVEIFIKENYKVSNFNCKLGESMGVNDKEDLAKLEKQFQEDMRKKFLKKGVTLIDPSSVYFSKDTKIGKDVVIYPNVYFGPGVKVGDKVTIKSFCDIELTKIGNSAVIGPFARLRGDTVIDNNAKIGNFVEVKKSKINHDVKISHLSYVGDSVIEKNTNIGAGTITCNFDGFNKNKTYIGENCFIGSNTSLIAPIKIKKNSVIGAGTVIDKNVQEGSVVYRKSQLIKKDKK